MATSYNGWPASPDPAAINVQPFAAGPISFPQGVRGGDVAAVLGYLVEQMHYRVEQMVPGYCWGYSYRENVNSPGSLSCHASATAVDVNAPFHGNGGSRYEGFNDAQVAEIRKILAELDDSVQWGADYTGTYDAMHFEIIVDAATLARVAATLPDRQDDTVTDDDMNEIANRVIDKLEAKVFRSNFAAKDSAGHYTVEDARDANIFDTLGSANTNTTRIYLGKSQH